ncbi:MAG: glycosyltransferase family 39 protein [Mangrovibacterium sp.]
MKQLIRFVSQYWILLLLVAIKICLQFICVNPAYDLHRDEFLHLDQAFHPAPGYISVPPFSSWTSVLIYLFGGGLFWVRLVPALFGALTIVLSWLIVEELGGRLHAKLLATTFLIFSVYARINVLFQPNSFDILSWTAMFYALIRYVRTHDLRWLLILALATALGLYNKYTVVFLITGLAAGLMLTRQRIILREKVFWLAIAFCLLLFMPNIIWQITHQWPVVNHMKALNDTQLVNITYSGFLLDQLKFGVIGVLTLASFWALLFYEPFRPYRFIGWTFLVVIVLFTLSRAKSYYALGLYPVLFSLGSLYLETVLKKSKAVVVPALITVNILLFFVVGRYVMPFQGPRQIIADRESYQKLGLLRWEDGRDHSLPQDFADMRGWREMADKALIGWQMIPENERKKTLVFCDNYGQAGALNYYNRKKMPEAYSFNTDYIYWLPRLDPISNVLLVGDQPGQDILDMFREIRIVGTVSDEFAREKGTVVFLLFGAKPGFTQLFYNMAEKQKAEFAIF